MNSFFFFLKKISVKTNICHAIVYKNRQQGILRTEVEKLNLKKNYDILTIFRRLETSILTIFRNWTVFEK